MSEETNNRFTIIEEYGFTYTPPSVKDGRYHRPILTYNKYDKVISAELLDDILAATGWTVGEAAKELIAICEYEYKQENEQ